MKERPILFSGAMVRAILAGRKTQTRRVINPQPQVSENGCPSWSRGDGKRIPGGPKKAFGGKAVTVEELIVDYCPYGVVGDRLWVRETWANIAEPGDNTPFYIYRAEPHLAQFQACWKPSIHMPRKASRLTLEITGVRLEKLQSVSEADAILEGIVKLANGRATLDPEIYESRESARLVFEHLWDALNKDRASWVSNPWVWVIEFAGGVA